MFTNELIDYNSLKKNLKKDPTSFPVIRLAILSDSATQMVVTALKGYGYEEKLNLEIFEADFDQVDRQVYDSSSELYRFDPQFIIIFFCINNLSRRFGNLSFNDKSAFAADYLSEIEKIYSAITSKLTGKLIFLNFPESLDAVFGHFGNKTDLSLTYQLRKINLGLMDLSQRLTNFFILDLNALQARFGSQFITDYRISVNTDLFFSIDCLPVIAKNTLDIIQANIGRVNKCLILDLDNTLWGGIIAEDGIENLQIGELGIGKAFSDFQRWAKQLKQRGIILAVCSKNDEVIAAEAFEKHPEMVLRMEDFTVFVANWNNKVDNILYIQSVLQIGFDSMVFIDDSPFERNMVRNYIKGIAVPEMPEDPAEYLNYLTSLNLFETSAFTTEDENRTKTYQEEFKRTGIRNQFANEVDFLKNLHMVSRVEAFKPFNIPRVSQLTQRSNQFNLRTVRYSEAEIQKIAGDPGFITRAFSLGDDYGDYGLIGIIILQVKPGQVLFVDTWIMSCRVLKRGMESFMLDQIIGIAKETGATCIQGEYIPTNKNGIVKTHFSDLGFKQEGNYWILNPSGITSGESYIHAE
ncbi:MAG: HAD-IIIC family phosphatase [Bacteroidetes bacterium]|nr:HAD-IIIC family phosphatase [Bacteroidota bacterium]